MQRDLTVTRDTHEDTLQDALRTGKRDNAL
jgi:hypothetical protein